MDPQAAHQLVLQTVHAPILLGELTKRGYDVSSPVVQQKLLYRAQQLAAQEQIECQKRAHADLRSLDERIAATDALLFPGQAEPADPYAKAAAERLAGDATMRAAAQSIYADFARQVGL